MRTVNSLIVKDHYEPTDEIMTDVPLSKDVSFAEQELIHQPSPLLQQSTQRASYVTTSPGVKMSATDTAPQSQSDNANIAGAASASAPQVQEPTVSIYSAIMHSLSRKLYNGMLIIMLRRPEHL
jgi:hypothetical protein